MNLGIRAHDVQIFDDIEQLSNRLKELGFSYLQFAPRVSLNKTTDGGKKVSFGLANQVKNALTKNQIQIAILGCYVNMIHPDLELREEGLEQFEDYLSLAGTFGANLVASETGSVDPEFHRTDDNYVKEVVDEAIKSIERLADTADKTGTLFGIEPGVNHPIHDIKTTQRVLDEVKSPNLKIVLDPMNLMLNKSDDEYAVLKNAIQVFGSKIYAFHIKDYDFIDGKKVGMPIGEGIAPLKEMLSLIWKEQPEAYVILDETPQKNFDISLKRIETIVSSI